jgi:RNAse (barnase) inhibitor barstar
MKEYIIDFSNVRTLWEFYERILTGMELPKWCGRNMDAVWDVLLDYTKTPAQITVKGGASMKKELKGVYTLLLETLQEAAQWFQAFDEIVKVRTEEE